MAALVSACGGANGGAGPPAEAATTTTPPTPVTTARPTTTLPPTTTIAPTTTPAPTTTVDQRARVIADFDATLAAFSVCTANPSQCDVATVAAPGSARFAKLTDLFAEFARSGVRGRPSDQDYVVVEEFQLHASGTTATLKTCMVDGGVTFDTRGNDDPSDDVVINDALDPRERPGHSR